VRATSASEYSSWPTASATANYSGEGESPERWAERQRRLKERNPRLGGLHLPLETAVQMWPNPDAGVFQDGMECTPEEWEARRQRLKENCPTPNGNGCGTPLAMAAHLWTTPRASDGEKGGPGQTFGAGGVPLAAQTGQWASPAPRDHKGGCPGPRGPGTGVQAQRKDQLDRQAEGVWATPGANIGSEAPSLRPSRLATGRKTEYLGRQVAMLTQDSPRPAPTMRRAGGRCWLRRLTWRLRCRGWIAWRLPGWVRSCLSRRSRRLNPAFVGWLMGWPYLWTNPGPINSDYLATVYTHWLAHMRSALFGLLSTAERSRVRGLFD
jgi:hypothetical protein